MTIMSFTNYTAVILNYGTVFTVQTHGDNVTQLRPGWAFLTLKISGLRPNAGANPDHVWWLRFVPRGQSGQPWQDVLCSAAWKSNGYHGLGYSLVEPGVKETNVRNITAVVAHSITAKTASNDRLTIGTQTRLYTGDLVYYSVSGETAIGETIAEATPYYIVRVSATQVQLATSPANARAGTVIPIGADQTAALGKLLEGGDYTGKFWLNQGFYVLAVRSTTAGYMDCSAHIVSGVNYDRMNP